MINLFSFGIFSGARGNRSLGNAALRAPEGQGGGAAAVLPLRFVYQPGEAVDFASAVRKRSGQNVFACYQCKRCASGCPVNEDTGGVTPNVLVRMVVLGDEKNAYSNDLLWKCLSCNTCGTRCPNNINTGRIVESLKKMTKEAGVQALRPEVQHFHTSCYNDSLRWGRVSELGLMGEYQLRNLSENLCQGKPRAIVDEIKTQAKFAFEMWKLKRLHLFFHTSRGRIEIRGLLEKSRGRKWI